MNNEEIIYIRKDTPYLREQLDGMGIKSHLLDNDEGMDYWLYICYDWGTNDLYYSNVSDHKFENRHCDCGYRDNIFLYSAFLFKTTYDNENERILHQKGQLRTEDEA